MKQTIDFRIFENLRDLPQDWDKLTASSLFLSKEYFQVLAASRPTNMECFAIGIYQNNQLAGCAMAQFLDLSHLETFGDRDKCFKTMVRDFTFRNFSSGVLFMGNNMLTGQHAFVVHQEISLEDAAECLRKAADELVCRLKKMGKKIHLVTFKDFFADESDRLKASVFSDDYRFSTQPNMILKKVGQWDSPDAYVGDLNKKYRDQYKRARKKMSLVERRSLSGTQIMDQEAGIYALYLHVAQNAPFNTFFLHPNHFSEMKKNLGDTFRLFGYYLEGKMIGFMTLIENGDSLETYFLGYDEGEQKEHMLYLNMLYDMVFYGIENKFSEIIFARTALEIKSSIGAEPVSMFGFIRHKNPLIQMAMPYIFPRFEPPVPWTRRHPFKSNP